MLGYIRKRPIQSSFLLDMLVKARNVHGTKTLILDQVFGNNEIAPFVSRKSAGHVVGIDGYTSITHVAPYIKEKIEYDEEDADVREPGTTGFGPAENIQALQARNLDELDMRIVGQEERQLAQALQTGTMVVAGEGTSYTVDYQTPDGNILELTGGDRWPTLLATSVAALYTGMNEDLNTWCQIPMAAGSPRPNFIIGDLNAITLIKTAFKSQLDTRRADDGFLKPEQLDNYNATYEGRIWGTGYDLRLYTYQANYSIDGSSANYMGSYMVVLGNNRNEVTLEYGKISNMHAKNANFKGRRFPNMWTEQDGSAEYITLESAPLINLRECRGFVAVHVTAAA